MAGQDVTGTCQVGVFFPWNLLVDQVPSSFSALNSYQLSSSLGWCGSGVFLKTWHSDVVGCEYMGDVEDGLGKGNPNCWCEILLEHCRISGRVLDRPHGQLKKGRKTSVYTNFRALEEHWGRQIWKYVLQCISYKLIPVHWHPMWNAMVYFDIIHTYVYIYIHIIAVAMVLMWKYQAPDSHSANMSGTELLCFAHILQ